MKSVSTTTSSRKPKAAPAATQDVKNEEVGFIDLGVINMVPVLNLSEEQMLETVAASPPSDSKQRVGVVLLSTFAKIPQYSTPDSACFDIYCNLELGAKINIFLNNNVKITREVVLDAPVKKNCLILDPGERAQLPTGLIFDIPRGMKLAVYPRSGLALKRGLRLANCEAVIDSDYVEETFILLENSTKVRQLIYHEERVAQAEIVPVIQAEFFTVDSIKQKTTRNGGLGHTGSF